MSTCSKYAQFNVAPRPNRKAIKGLFQIDSCQPVSNGMWNKYSSALQTYFWEISFKALRSLVLWLSLLLATAVPSLAFLVLSRRRVTTVEPSRAPLETTGSGPLEVLTRSDSEHSVDWGGEYLLILDLLGEVPALCLNAVSKSGTSHAQRSRSCLQCFACASTERSAVQAIFMQSVMKSWQLGSSLCSTLYQGAPSTDNI